MLGRAVDRTTVSRASGVPVRNRMGFTERTAPWWLSLLGIALFLGLWQWLAGSGLVSQASLPSPGSVLQAFGEMIRSGDLWQNFSASITRIIFGYAIGASTGILIGLLFGSSRVFERLGMPLASAFYPIPKIAIIPLVILWVGAGESPKILIIAAEAFFPVMFSTFAGVRNVDPVLIKTAVAFGASRTDVVRKVILPASLPSIFAGLRIAAGLSLLVLVAAEMVGAQYGLGAMLLKYSSLMLTTYVLVGVIVLMILGMVITKGLALLEDRLLPWKSQ